MAVKIAYGDDGIEINLPDSAEMIILRPKEIPGLADERGAILTALRNPVGSKSLAEMAKAGMTAVIVHSDITRATPNARLLPPIIKELEAAGIAPEDITLINGLGTHRRQTEAETRALLGAEIADTYRTIQHNCADEENLIDVGQLSTGNRFRVNRTYLEADLKILTGFIEPHFFAGFSGGPKAVLPALAGEESVFSNHNYARIAHAKASWGITAGNPIWEEMREAALMTNPDFLVNVALNNEKEITAVFAGDMLAAHEQGCAFVKENSMAGVEREFDIMITSNSGYPLDQNLYQAVKGMDAAARIVRQDGAILLFAECRDGLPDHGEYARLLREGGSPTGVLAMVSADGFLAQDQWQVQIQAQAQIKADVYVYAGGLTDKQIRDALLTPCSEPEELLARLVEEKGKRVCVLPNGPQVIPYIKEGVRE